MDSLDILDAIADSMSDNGVITDEGCDYVFSCLREPGMEVLTKAIGMIRLLHKKHLQKLTSIYHSLPLQTQRILIPVIGSTDTCHQIYTILFDELTMTRDPVKLSLVTETLGRTPFQVFPFILKYLNDSTLESRPRIIEVIKRVGLKNLAPMLAMFPEIPEENAFRKAFGNAAINALLAK